MKIEEILNKVICGDCLEKLKDLEDNSVDSIVTDPPYELGFMGKSWDSTGIAYNVELWKECLRVLKPGGHLLAFSGTRTYHRMAVAIEDAGFEVRDMIEWCYGSGFPKSLNIGKAVDKLQGNEREIVGYAQSNPDLRDVGRISKENCGIDKLSFGQGQGCKRQQTPIDKGTSEWEGWGTALKPAHEPICMARKPLAEKTVAENCLKWGTGGINIDESRVESKPRLTGTLKKGDEIKAEPTSFKGSGTRKLQTGYDEKMAESNLGRFPANLVLEDCEEVRECFPEAKGASSQNNYSNGKIYRGQSLLESKTKLEGHRDWYNDNGNASRFFKSILYYPKASKSERNCGLDSIVLLDIMEVWKENNTTKEEKLIRLVVSGLSPEKVIVESGTAKKKDKEWNTFLFGKELMEKYQQDTGYIIKTETNSITVLETWNYLMHLLTKGYIQGVKLETATGGNLVGSVESYSELIITINEKTASLLGVKNAVSPTQLKISVKEGSNFHSTVKPIALMEYLIKMVTPKGGIVLDPFAGSGSTLVAAKQNGFQYIGIELTEEYIPIIEARLNALNQYKLL